MLLSMFNVSRSQEPHVYSNNVQTVKMTRRGKFWTDLVNGHVDIVMYAAIYATEGDCVLVRERSSALSSAISVGHTDVIEYLLNSTTYEWGSDGDSGEDSKEEEAF
ncbi:hypothetical protein KRP22_009880 [Phytophthora ramorum]|nr:hypothetical protein KRP22_10053 [Phytophthora ramorum]